METRKTKTKVVAAVLALAALCVFSLFAVGGNLEPNAPPGPTMHTLDEIYNEVTSAGSENGDSIPHHSEVEGSGAIHISLTGENQGVIDGSCTAAGKEGTSVVVGFEHDVHIPLDTDTGQPTGVRVHQPLSIVKLIDKASPKLYQALVTGERLTVEIKWYRIDPMGGEEHYFTTKLEDAIIVAIKPSLLHMEDVSFTYSKIRWTWEPDGITAQDDWLTPRP